MFQTHAQSKFRNVASKLVCNETSENCLVINSLNAIIYQ